MTDEPINEESAAPPPAPGAEVPGTQPWLPTFRTSPQRNHYLAALLEFQKAAATLTIAKNNTAKVQGKTDAGVQYKYEYKYADIADVLKTITPETTKVGLVIEQTVIEREHGKLSLVTLITHAPSGQWHECDYPLVTDVSKIRDHKTVQGFITAVRRYALCPMIGVAADEPTASEEGDHVPDNIPPTEERLDDRGDDRRPPPSQPAAPPRSNGPPRGQTSQQATADNLQRTIDAEAERTRAALANSSGSSSLADEPDLPLNEGGAAPTTGPKQPVPGTNAANEVVDFPVFKDQFAVPALKAPKFYEDVNETFDRIIKKYGPSMSEAARTDIKTIALQMRRALPRKGEQR